MRACHQLPAPFGRVPQEPARTSSAHAACVRPVPFRGRRHDNWRFSDRATAFVPTVSVCLAGLRASTRTQVAVTAANAGRSVSRVDLRHTAQRCPVRSATGASNRTGQATFRYVACGYAANTSLTAAANVSARTPGRTGG